MLEFALYVFLFELIDRWFSSNLKKKLYAEPSSQKRILIRKKVKRNRKIQLAIFATYLVVYEIVIVYLAITGPFDQYLIRDCFMFPTGCFIYFGIWKKWKRIKGNISTSDMDSFDYKGKKYSLYLRGFDTDNYEKIDKLENNRKEVFDTFSEYWFFKLLKKRYKQQVVSVGMTKELDSPQGTLRIYLDDEDWKNGVATLMDNAERIFILINDRESCIWEIIQSKNCLNKTVFISDNQQKYDTARNEVMNIIQLPEVPIEHGQCVSVTFPAGKPVTAIFENSRMGYAGIIGVKYITTKFKRKLALWGCLVPMGILFLFVMTILISSFFRRSYHTKETNNTELSIEESVSAEVDPYDEIENVISQINYPYDYGNGVTLKSIKVNRDKASLYYQLHVNTDSIEMELLKEYAKSNFIEAIHQEDIKSQELQFWLYCMNHNISIEYKYIPDKSSVAPVIVILTPEELKSAFNERQQ